MSAVPTVLKLPVIELQASEAFKQWAGKNKWETLEQLLAVHAGELQRSRGFTMHIWMELADILQKNGLDGLLRQRRGA